ncbi:type II toxin-antitoxin system RelE/ParE family toxin [bacterium]|nr:MAG: type II toxin-antitoxin system RelE/ParE family toxin [bacterium]
MTYTLVYQREVVDEDIPAVPPGLRPRLAKAIEARLTTHPEQYGRPLRGTLAGYWKLRVGDFRVVFRVVGKEVVIHAIRNRKDVYSDILKRLD